MLQARCEAAGDYTKRANVFRLACADGAEYLFSASSRQLMQVCDRYVLVTKIHELFYLNCPLFLPVDIIYMVAHTGVGSEDIVPREPAARAPADAVQRRRGGLPYG